MSVELLELRLRASMRSPSTGRVVGWEAVLPAALTPSSACGAVTRVMDRHGHWGSLEDALYAGAVDQHAGWLYLEMRTWDGEEVQSWEVMSLTTTDLGSPVETDVRRSDR